MNLYRTIIASGSLLVSGALIFTSIASAQSINTGDASAVTILENQINTNRVKLCTNCVTPEPTKEPSPTQEQPRPTETQPTNTPTPTNPPSNGGGENNGGVGGVGGPEPEKQGEVLGAQVLAATGNFPSDLATIQQVLGVAIGAAGLFYGRKIKK